MTIHGPEWTFWKQVQQKAVALAHSLHVRAPQLCKPHTRVTSTSTSPIPPLDLPYPHDILAPITTLRIPDDMRTKILSIFDHRITKVQHDYSIAYKEAFTLTSTMSFGKFDPNSLRQTYHGLYRRRILPVLQSKVTMLLEMATRWQQAMRPERKHPFNAEYIPLLETYFENNAYPSALDRRLLAQKSMMTPRQIEVWFQNHRNRAKKDGKTLKRLADSPPRSILNSLERKMPHLLVPVSERAQSSADNSDDDSEDEDFDMSHKYETVAFCIDASATYQDAPVFGRDFTRQPFVPTPLHWRRKPASTPVTARIVDMDEFINAFSSLNIRSSSLKKPRKRKSNGGALFPWFAATTTVPSCAPHPALVSRCANTYRPSAISTVKLPASCVDWSTRFSSCEHDSLSHSTRKVPSIPRRAPSTTPFNRYIPISPSSSSLSAVDSRTPSLSSVASSQSRSSSYSSISSQDEPKTPPMPPSIQQESILTQEDFAELEALFQGSHTLLDDLLSQNLAFDLPPDDFSGQTPIIMPVVPSYSAPPYSASYPAPSYSTPSYPAPSYSAPSYSAPSCSDHLNNLLFIPDTNFLQV